MVFECMNILYNKKHQPFVINKTFRINGYTYCEIKFLDTGSIREVRKSVVDERTVKDRYAKDVCGVACIGNAKKTENLKEYTLWKNMIERCYRPSNNHYYLYGKKGVKVCDRWLCFEYFLDDLPSIDGYDYNKFYNGEIQLDKDKKQINCTNKVYSIDTCTFISSEENNLYRILPKVVMKSVKVKCIAIHVESGVEVYVEHVPTFARENGLQACKIYQCINGKRKQHKGWVFKNEL